MNLILINNHIHYQNGLSVEFFSKYKHEKEVLFFNNLWVFVNMTLYHIRSHHFKYFLNGLMLLQSILSGNIEKIERYKNKLLNKRVQKYLICLLECVMGMRIIKHKCIDYFINSVYKFITANIHVDFNMLINKRYLMSKINEFDVKLLNMLFDNTIHLVLDHLLNIVGINVMIRIWF